MKPQRPFHANKILNKWEEDNIQKMMDKKIKGAKSTLPEGAKGHSKGKSSSPSSQSSKSPSKTSSQRTPSRSDKITLPDLDQKNVNLQGLDDMIFTQMKDILGLPLIQRMQDKSYPNQPTPPQSAGTGQVRSRFSNGNLQSSSAKKISSSNIPTLSPPSNIVQPERVENDSKAVGTMHLDKHNADPLSEIDDFESFWLQARPSATNGAWNRDSPVIHEKVGLNIPIKAGQCSGAQSNALGTSYLSRLTSFGDGNGSTCSAPAATHALSDKQRCSGAIPASDSHSAASSVGIVTTPRSKTASAAVRSDSLSSVLSRPAVLGTPSNYAGERRNPQTSAGSLTPYKSTSRGGNLEAGEIEVPKILLLPSSPQAAGRTGARPISATARYADQKGGRYEPDNAPTVPRATKSQPITNFKALQPDSCQAEPGSAGIVLNGTNVKQPACRPELPTGPYSLSLEDGSKTMQPYDVYQLTKSIQALNTLIGMKIQQVSTSAQSAPAADLSAIPHDDVEPVSVRRRLTEEPPLGCEVSVDSGLASSLHNSDMEYLQHCGALNVMPDWSIAHQSCSHSTIGNSGWDIGAQVGEGSQHDIEKCASNHSSFGIRAADGSKAQPQQQSSPLNYTDLPRSAAEYRVQNAHATTTADYQQSTAVPCSMKNADMASRPQQAPVGDCTNQEYCNDMRWADTADTIELDDEVRLTGSSGDLPLSMPPLMHTQHPQPTHNSGLIPNPQTCQPECCSVEHRPSDFGPARPSLAAPKGETAETAEEDCYEDDFEEPFVEPNEEEAPIQFLDSHQEHQSSTMPIQTHADLVRASQSLAGKLQQLREIMKVNQLAEVFQPGAASALSENQDVPIDGALDVSQTTQNLEGVGIGDMDWLCGLMTTLTSSLQTDSAVTGHVAAGIHGVLAAPN